MYLRARIHHEEIFRDRIVKFQGEFSWKGFCIVGLESREISRVEAPSGFECCRGRKLDLQKV